MKLLLRWLISAIALLLISQLVPGVVVASFYIALITALILGLVNALIRPLAIILTLPINIITLGLFVLVINGLLFWFVSSFIQGFEVEGFVPAFVGALLMSLISWFANTALKDTQKE